MNNNRIYYTIIMMLTLFYSIEANGQARTTLFKGAVKLNRDSLSLMQMFTSQS